jgi:DNA-binding response OmpR family regulator
MYRVLLVAEDLALRRLLFAKLLASGYSVAEAESVAQADEAFAAWVGMFDLLVLDINLPDGSGWDVLRHLARRVPAIGQNGSQMPKVVILASARPAQCRLDEFNPTAVLIQPFPMRALLDLIHRMLRGTPAEVETGEAGIPHVLSAGRAG